MSSFFETIILGQQLWQDEIRPEFIQAVSDATYSWSLWIIPIIPAIAIWGLSALIRKPNWWRAPLTIVLGTLSISVLAQLHAERISIARFENIETDAELKSWSHQESWWYKNYNDSLGITPVVLPLAVLYCCMMYQTSRFVFPPTDCGEEKSNLETETGNR